MRLIFCIAYMGFCCRTGTFIAFLKIADEIADEKVK